MCGILASISSRSDVQEPDQRVLEQLRQRGPDCFNHFSIGYSIKNRPHPNSSSVSFAASVLALRGGLVQAQPLVDNESGSIFCWNGDAWTYDGTPVTGNDTRVIFELLLAVSRTSTDDFVPDVVALIAKIAGPFSFVFYNAFHSRIFYGRDRLGRRSLLISKSENGSMALASVGADWFSSSCEEIDTNGVHVLDLKAPTSPVLVPWPNPLPTTNKIILDAPAPSLNVESQCVADLGIYLRNSLELRIAHLTDPSNGPPEPRSLSDSRLAILFSGGLDCTILARLSHDLLDSSSPIDLLNVAFENPRSIAASTPSNKSPYEICPDRITGRGSHGELQQVCPNRIWRFVAIDVPFAESEAHRSTILQLMAPHNTEMDLSIAKALYFAARGTGTVTDPSSEHLEPYTTPARVLLSGLGADELFGGYTRHKTAFDRRGYLGLVEELDLDTQRLGQRNLGRDDRIISRWGRQARYPFLDEDFLSWAVGLPVWEKCGYGETPSPSSLVLDIDEPVNLDPAKKALRLLAWKLRMRHAAREKKRAIQFGARTAKMDVSRMGKGKTRGTDVVQ